MKKMKFIISHHPRDYKLELQQLGKGHAGSYDSANDEMVVIDQSPYKKDVLLVMRNIGFVMLFVGVFMLLQDPDFLFRGLPQLLIILVPLALFTYAYWKYVPEKKVLILNRWQGTIAFPGFLFGKPTIVPFHKISVYAVRVPRMRYHYLEATHTNDFWHRLFRSVSLGGGEPVVERPWSYWLWYMDRNRPLPPGSALDAYRQQDYERRKAAGFPAPLYESEFPTPERETVKDEYGSWTIREI